MTTTKTCTYCAGTRGNHKGFCLTLIDGALEEWVDVVPAADVPRFETLMGVRLDREIPPGDKAALEFDYEGKTYYVLESEVERISAMTRGKS